MLEAGLAKMKLSQSKNVINSTLTLGCYKANFENLKLLYLLYG